MGKTEKPVNKPLYIILAIVVACVLWLYVRSVDNEDKTARITNIPVSFVGEDVLNANGLMFTPKGDETVSLTVQGKWNVISQLRRDNILVQVDLSRIVAEGEYNRAYDIIWPGHISTSSFSLVDRDPFYVPVSVSRRVSVPVELRGVFTGSVAKGYEAGEFSFQPGEITVSGETSYVSKVAYAQVTLNREDLDKTVREEMGYTLIDNDGSVLECDTLSAVPATVSVTLPVVMVKEVPLSVDLVAGGGADPADGDHVQVEISPKTIMLSGSESDLSAYQDINLGAIDLSKIIGTDSQSFIIPIGPEVDNVSGVQEATVKVTVRGLETRTFEVENIEIINAPEGVTVTPVTQSVQVQVRGSAETLDMVLPQYIKVVVDLKDQSLPAGQNVVTPKVTLNGISDAGVIGSYRVSISLERGIG